MKLKPLAALLLLVALTTPATAKPDAYKAGRVVTRTTKNGVVYAVYVPLKWRKKRPLPLVLHVPHAKYMPADVLRVPYVRAEFDVENEVEGRRALHATVLFEAHNKENQTQKESIDAYRFASLLERDVHAAADVVEDVAAEVGIQRDAVFIRGSGNTAEVALGIASRRPDLFAAVALKDVNFTTRMIADGVYKWLALPQDDSIAAARDLPVVVTWDPGEPNGDARKEIHHCVRDILRLYGFRRIDLVPGIPGDSYRRHMNPEGFARLFEVLAEQRRRAGLVAERDAILEDARAQLEKGRLKRAVQLFVKARGKEGGAGLDAASDVLYAELESRGRALLKAADALEPAQQRTEYRKVQRLFKGTPLAAEIEEGLRGG